MRTTMLRFCQSCSRMRQWSWDFWGFSGRYISQMQSIAFELYLLWLSTWSFINLSHWCYLSPLHYLSAVWKILRTAYLGPSLGSIVHAQAKWEIYFEIKDWQNLCLVWFRVTTKLKPSSGSFCTLCLRKCFFPFLLWYLESKLWHFLVFQIKYNILYRRLLQIVMMFVLEENRKNWASSMSVSDD